MTGQDSIQRAVTVQAPLERAFALFTDGFGTWWPREYTWGRDACQDIGIEPQVGGRCVERGPHGFICDWGRVLAWDPPQRLVLAWQIGPQRAPEPDPAKASEVEVRFTADGAEATRVELEHRGFARHGEDGAGYREGLASPQGWTLLLDRYGEAAASAAARDAVASGAASAAHAAPAAPDYAADPDRAALLQMVFGFTASQVIATAARLGVADALGDGRRTVDELAEDTLTHAPSLLRLLRAMAGLELLGEVEPGRFALLPRGRWLRAQTPGSVGELAKLFCRETVWRTWGALDYSVQTGEVAFEHLYGCGTFEYMRQRPELLATFNEAMAEHTREVAPALIAGYDFAPFATVVDVGGGNGTLLAAILAATPGQRGILFDTPAGAEAAPGVLATAGVAERVEIVEGDFFEAVPPGGDAYVLKSVIHDWDDERSVAILRNCRRAMRAGGKLLLAEMVMPPQADAPEAGRIAMSDLNMLVVASGRERTEAEFEGLLRAAGFTLTAVTERLKPTNYCLVEGTPA